MSQQHQRTQQPQQYRQQSQGFGQQPMQGQGSSQSFGQPSQQGQSFDQSVPSQVADTVYTLEQIETDAEWAKEQAIKQGDSATAIHLEDVEDLAHVQKKLLLRQSPLSSTIGRCAQQGFQQASQQLQQSQVPGVQQVVQQVQQVSQTIGQASRQFSQSGGQQSMTGQSTSSGQFQQSSGGQQPSQQY